MSNREPDVPTSRPKHDAMSIAIGAHRLQVTTRKDENLLACGKHTVGPRGVRADGTKLFHQRAQGREAEQHIVHERVGQMDRAALVQNRVTEDENVRHQDAGVVVRNDQCSAIRQILETSNVRLKEAPQPWAERAENVVHRARVALVYEA